MSEQEDSDRIKRAMTEAGDLIAEAIEKTSGTWDYLIVTVPAERTPTMINMMASVTLPELPFLLQFLSMAYRRSAATGRIIDTTTITEGKPS